MKLLARWGLLLGTLLAVATGTGCRRQPERAAPEPVPASADRLVSSALPPAPTAPGSSGPPPAKSISKAADRNDPSLELLDPGAEPRAKLRYTFQEDQSDELQLKQKMTMSMRLGNDVMPKTPAPETTIAMKLDVIRLDNDVATTRFSVTDATMSLDPAAPPGSEAGVDRLLKDLRSYHGTQQVNRRGVLLSFDQDTTGITNPQISQMMNSMEQSMNQMVAPLPKQAIGRGAKWRTVTHADQFGLNLQQTALFEVRKIDDLGIDLDVVLAQTAPPGRISAPGLPPGVTVNLLSMDSAGKAKMRIDLDRLVPTTEMDMTVKMKMKVPQAAGSGTDDQIMDMTMDMVMNIAPK
jgi:hypothetical protein